MFEVTNMQAGFEVEAGEELGAEGGYFFVFTLGVEFEFGIALVYTHYAELESGFNPPRLVRFDFITEEVFGVEGALEGLLRHVAEEDTLFGVVFMLFFG